MSASHTILSRQKILSIPAKVKVDDLHDNLKLLSDSEIKQLTAEHTLLSGRNKKAILNTGYDVSLIKGELYAISRGSKKKGAIKSSHSRSVKLAQNLNTGEWIIIKIIKLANDEKAQKRITTYKKEVEFLKQVGQYIGREVRENSSKEQQVEIYMKLAPGTSLYEFVASAKILASIEYIEIMISLLNSCEDLLSRGILHRDIKDHNIMFEVATFILKIVDYGLSVQVGEDRAYRGGVGSGTGVYIAPEISRDNNDEHAKATYNEKTEIYALAITFTRLLDRTEVEDFERAYARSALISITDYTFSHRVTDRDVRVKIKENIDAMGKMNPGDRPTIKECLASFEKIHSNLPESQKIIMVGCVDIGDLKLDGKLTRLSKALCRMDRVCIVEKQGFGALSEVDYLKHKRALESMGMFVLDEVVRYDSNINANDLNAQVAAYFKTLPNAADRLYTPYYFLNKKNRKNVTLKNQFTSAGELYLKSSDEDCSLSVLRSDAIHLNSQVVSTCVNQLELEKKRLEGRAEITDKRAERIAALSLAIGDLSAQPLLRFGVFNRISKRLTKVVGLSQSSRPVEEALGAVKNSFTY